MSSNTTIPAPISWTPSTYWDGNDGKWNSFIVQAGTPPQDFRVFPSTAGQELWIPVPAGCTSISPSDPGYCGYLRGTLPVNGANSSGFAANESSTWEVIGLFTLDAQELQLGYGGNGNYGFDTIVLGNASASPKLEKQVVAGVADPDWWLGVIGLGPKSINFTNYNEPLTGILSSLVNESTIPSLSWGYTAGASYRNDSPASLTFGGYDTNRFTGPGLSLTMNADDSRSLLVGVQKILATNTLNGDVNLLPKATYHFVDSTLPHIWLPDESIDVFVSAFGLTYDNSTDLFLINDTMHSQMLSLNPSITFILGESTQANSGDTQNIVFTYAAFDLQASYPFYQNATNYFPIRRAANDTQYTIGRTFLQEAYVIADYGRQNFTIAQTSFANMNTEHLVAIQQPIASGSNSTTSSTTDNSSSGISAGAIAGIVVGAILGLALLAAGIWFLIRRKKQRNGKYASVAAAAEAEKADAGAFPDDKKPPFAGPELPSESQVYEAPSHASPMLEAPGVDNQIHEFDSPAMRSEVEGEPAKWGRGGMQELGAKPVGHESGLLAEAPGSEGVRYELAGSEGFEPAVRKE